MITFKPPTATIDAIEVKFYILFSDFELFNRSTSRFLLGLSYLCNNLLNELATLYFELGLDVVGREGGRQAVLREEVVEDAIIWLEVEECLLGI